ncbi:ATP-binding protein [Pseudoxanthomonas sp. UTMC 1351]|uniref:ATP-binding protein n=1 Tax=Pseudoxanthomonas sp. UTMC 1351 TaxID=2695853 RepID=UPI0034CD08FE
MNNPAVRGSILDSNRRLGSVCAIYPGRVLINLGAGSARPQTMLYGSPLGTGQVGEYVLVEVDHRVILGRVTAVRLLERERLAINPSLDEPKAVDPIGEVDLLATLDQVSDELSPGIEAPPRLGSAVYAPAPALLGMLVAKQRGVQPQVCLDLGTAMALPEARIQISPERLFGRHCAILGATGGGKSYTVAKLIEEVAGANGKAILIDATGEFYTLDDLAQHVSLGASAHGESEAHLPFSALDEQDLYALFQPSGKVQGPKLREALHSLRIAHILANSTDSSRVSLRTALERAEILANGLVSKIDKPRQPFEAALLALRSEIEAPNAPFDVTLLAAQVVEECCYPNTKYKAGFFGGSDDGASGWCSPLISRINAVTHGKELRVFFSDSGDNLLDVIAEFFRSSAPVLRISLASIPYSFNAREIVANAIGRQLLSQARGGAFRNEKPVVVFLDEAHNFLNRRIGDEEAMVQLDAFDQIAKEGRKHWLTVALATQRPRDLPEGVLSQMGTMMVHRLTNHKDRELVERACGDIDRASVALLPTFAPGHAAIVGVDFPFPLTIMVDQPIRRPDSRGPSYQDHWKPGGSPPHLNTEVTPTIEEALSVAVAAAATVSAGITAATQDIKATAAHIAKSIVAPYVANLDRPDDDDKIPF